MLISTNLYANNVNRAEVTLLGTFHFTNPGLDIIKNKQIDVSTLESQTYLKQLTSKISGEFTPTKVLVECPKNTQETVDKNYSQYLEGNFKLPINEMYQIGFRVAKKAKVKSLTCFDERDIQWQAEAMVKAISENDTMQKRFQKVIKELTDVTNDMFATLSLQQIIKAFNEPSFERKNKSLYILTNEVGATDKYEGADAAASWWHRNFRMYANIQKAAQPGEKVLVIGGQGHTAILKDFLADDEDRDEIDINIYLN